MSFGHCSCPDCDTTLRIRDRTFVGRQVQCPECHVALVIELDRDEVLTARKPPRDPALKSAATAVTSAAAETGSRAPTRVDELRSALSSPLALAWALALAVSALFVVAMFRPAVRFGSPGSSVRPQAAADNPVTPVVEPKALDSTLHPTPVLTAPLDPLANPTADATATVNDSKPHPTTSPLSQQPDGGPTVKPVETVAVTPIPPAPPVPPPTPRIDFDAILKQRLQSFDQSKPVSRRELIELMEELIGAPIRYDVAELGEKNLDKQVTFKVENPTLGGLLKTILEPAGWEFVTDETQLRVRRKPPE